MEAVMGEANELQPEDTTTASCDIDVHVNGEMNGVEAMEVCSIRSPEKLITTKKLSDISDECLDDSTLAPSPEEKMSNSEECELSSKEIDNKEDSASEASYEGSGESQEATLHDEIGGDPLAPSPLTVPTEKNVLSHHPSEDSLYCAVEAENSCESRDMDNFLNGTEDEDCSEGNFDRETPMELDGTSENERESKMSEIDEDNISAMILDKSCNSQDSDISKEENEDSFYQLLNENKAQQNEESVKDNSCTETVNKVSTGSSISEDSVADCVDNSLNKTVNSKDSHQSENITDNYEVPMEHRSNIEGIEEDRPVSVDKDNDSRDSVNATDSSVNDSATSVCDEVRQTGNSAPTSVTNKEDTEDSLSGVAVEGETVTTVQEPDSGKNVNDFSVTNECVSEQESAQSDSKALSEDDEGVQSSDNRFVQSRSESVSSLDKISDKEDLESKTDGDPLGKNKKKTKTIATPLTPRRSSRNLNKQKSYIEKEDDPDIQEIAPVDPLAITDPLRDDKENSKYRNSKKTTIVVNDTKRLAEIAAGTKHIKGKKEPTLVIIDTNSILAGKGPVPLSQEAPSLAGPSSNATYSVLPVAIPAQGMYPRMSNPIISAHAPRLATAVPPPQLPPQPQPQPQPPPPPPPAPASNPLLPTLTDDMFVVEAPSFIVPYVYEKPPLKPLKQFIAQLRKELEEEKKKEKNDVAALQSSSEKDTDTAGETVNTVGTENLANEETRGTNDSKTTKTKDQEINLKTETSETRLGSVEERNLKDPLAVDSATKNVDVGKKEEKTDEDKEKPHSFFEEPTGKFFIDIGMSLVHEYVQTELLRTQKRRRDREGGRPNTETQFAINSLLKTLESSKENNEPFRMELKKCEYCSFKTESSLVMAQHLETPHMRNYVYRCNFCPMEVRSPHDILFHMEADHNVRGRLERAPAFHQCPNCPFEDNQKGKLSRHLLSCAKKHKPERNQEPPIDWEPPAKIPKVQRSRTAPPLGLGAAAYQAVQGKTYSQHPLLPKLVQGAPLPAPVGGLMRRGRPPLHSRFYTPQDLRPAPVQPPPQPRHVAPTQLRQGMLYRQAVPPNQSQVLLPTTYQLSNSQLYQMVGSPGQMMPMMPAGIPSVPRLTIMPPSTASAVASVTAPVALVPNITAGSNSITIQSANSKNPAAKLLQQPSISITPLPRQTTGVSQGSTQNSKHPGLPGHPGTPGAKPTFVICEICDGYIKDLEQLRNHMQWIHKVKIHPKMIYNRPPLNCQKCQFRFFTDQGLERHLLGSHGLVTSSMQDASNKGKDSGRCPVCGRVYQWKLLSHVARDHNMSLKPAHLSYKCTVCTATFGMYKQFENHVYSAHSVVAKRGVVDKKTTQPPRLQSGDTHGLIKPLKINDEITIIPQPARPRPGPASRTGAISAAMQQKQEKVYYCEQCEATFDGPSGYIMYVGHMKRRHLRLCNVKVCRLEDCPTCSQHVSQEVLDHIADNKTGVDVIELSDDELLIAGQGRNEITITKVPCAPGPKRFKHKLQQRSNVQVIELEDSPAKNKTNDDTPFRENGEDSLHAVKERLRRRKSLEISQVDSECSSPISGDDIPSKRRKLDDE